MKFKVAEEVALQDFQRLCDAYRVDLSEEDREDWHDTRAGIVKLIRKGSLVVGADGLATYTTVTGKSVTFQPPTGATILALETYGKGKDVANMTAAMADMCECGRDVFAKMSAPDFKACGRIAGLFLTDE
jgi:hypothetical protein